MIHSFSVENFLSIRDKQVISFEATKDKTNKDLLTVEVKPNCFINKLAIFYGANASGKSNLLYALETIFSLLIIPYFDKQQTIGKYSPFALKKGESTKFSVSFFIEDIQYDYYIEYCLTHIVSERLYYYPTRNKALFYSRDFKDMNTRPKITFGTTLKLQLKSKRTIEENTLNNHTVLSTVAKVSLNSDSEKIINLHNWIINKVHNVDGDNRNRSMVYEMSKVCEDTRKKDFYLKLLSKADFNIIDFNIIDNNVPKDLIERIISIKEFSEEQKMAYLKNVAFVNSSKNGNFEVESQSQSDGTLRFTELLDYLYDLVHENHIYLFDELGNRMHYDLMVYYLSLFLHNSEQSQLFFTTHSIMLLDEYFIRRDMIYLSEKESNTASTSYNRVSEMGLHKNLSLFNAYKIGKLGAKPEIGSPYLMLNKKC